MAEVPGAAACPVCWSDLAGSVVACMRCKAPHHADCVGFVGRCATFGCGGEEFEEYRPPDPAGAVALVTIDGESDLAPSPAREKSPARPSLRRGILARLRAAVGLLAASPGIALPMVGLQMLVDLSMAGGMVQMVVTILVQAMLVVLLLAKARGKSSSLREALALANQRGGRMVVVGFGAALLSAIPLAVSFGLLAAGLFVSPGGLEPVASIALVVAGGLALGLSLAVSVSFSLASIVAAMGIEEEPSNALARSWRLVGLARSQAVAAWIAGFVVPVLLAGWVQSRFALAVLTGPLTLLVTTYWFLFYIEARRALQQTYLPHAAAGFLPERPAARASE